MYVIEDITRNVSKNPQSTDLAGQLRTAFAKSGLSRFEFARRAGISYAIVHRFIGGDRDVTLATASKMAAVLGLALRKVPRPHESGDR